MRWNVDGKSSNADCPKADSFWHVLVDGAMQGVSRGCAIDEWTSGIFTATLGSHQFTVRLVDGAGTLFGTKTATSSITTTDPNTIDEVMISFTASDF